MISSSKAEFLEQLERFGIKILHSLTTFPLVQARVCKLPYTFAKKHKVLPLEERKGECLVAMANPFNLSLIEELRSLLGLGVEGVFASPEEIELAIDLCYERHSETSDYIDTLGKKEEEEEGDDEYDLLENKSDSVVIRLLNLIFREAIQQGASDIHLEPQENALMIRYRIDGVLQERHAPPKEYQSQLISRIKVMAKLDIAEQRLPQDGRIKLRMGDKAIDLRVSTVPTLFGERIVLRILDRSNVLFGLSQLSMPEHIFKHFKTLISQNQGIILVTGPTGSGKTTTLYSAISDINSPAVNIMTIEDPVEYKLANMAQINVNRKIHLSFAMGLRHILRQDPDVIMIGEIRDIETAEIAIQASLTGHLVFSTLHTNDAPAALTRLVDMGIESYLLTSSILGVMAQRLVRTLCPHCKTSYVPTPEELADLGIETDMLWRSTGCDQCLGVGYKGRRGVYELMDMTSNIKQQLLKNVDATGLYQIALQEGMRPLRLEAALLAKEGVTSSQEVLRVTKHLTAT